MLSPQMEHDQKTPHQLQISSSCQKELARCSQHGHQGRGGRRQEKMLSEEGREGPCLRPCRPDAEGSCPAGKRCGQSASVSPPISPESMRSPGMFLHLVVPHGRFCYICPPLHGDLAVLAPSPGKGVGVTCVAV